MIISFSGLDGAGKTTQIKMLLAEYRNQGAKVGSIYSIFPDIRYHDERELLFAYNKLQSCDVILLRYRLNSDKNNAIMHKLESLPLPLPELASQAALQGFHDHLELDRNIIEPLVERGKTIIFDRFFYDELAFKYIFGCPESVLNKLYADARAADVGFYIHIPAEECLNRNRMRPDGTVNIYKEKKHVIDLINRFNVIAERKKLVVLNGTNTRETIKTEILSALSFS